MAGGGSEEREARASRSSNEISPALKEHAAADRSTEPAPRVDQAVFARAAKVSNNPDGCPLSAVKRKQGWPRRSTGSANAHHLLRLRGVRGAGAGISPRHTEQRCGGHSYPKSGLTQARHQRNFCEEALKEQRISKR